MGLAVHGPGVWSGMERGVDRETVSVVIATSTAKIPPRVCKEQFSQSPHWEGTARWRCQ